MTHPIMPGFSTLGILAPMDPSMHHYNSYIGPLVTSDWSSPTVDVGRNFMVSQSVLQGVPEAMRAFDVVNFLFPV